MYAMSELPERRGWGWARMMAYTPGAVGRLARSLPELAMENLPHFRKPFFVRSVAFIKPYLRVVRP
jgi:hypothetical protein